MKGLPQRWDWEFAENPQMSGPMPSPETQHPASSHVPAHRCVAAARKSSFQGADEPGRAAPQLHTWCLAAGAAPSPPLSTGRLHSDPGSFPPKPSAAWPGASSRVQSHPSPVPPACLLTGSARGSAALPVLAVPPALLHLRPRLPKGRLLSQVHPQPGLPGHGCVQTEDGTPDAGLRRTQSPAVPAS